MSMRLTLLTAAVAGGLLAVQTAPARADMMSACAPEIGRYCADVSQGRGRIAACLASRRDQLGPACLSEVQAVSQGRLIPSDARRLLTPGFSAALPATCDTAAAQLCPGIPPGDGRVFACLYARGNRVGGLCMAAAKAAVGG